MVVEEPFTLFKPAGGAGGGDSEEDRQAGDGCYVSATVHNRRYYGLLVDQEALKSASLLWFQEEAGSLDLNRRMKMLRGETPIEADQTNGAHKANGMPADEAKKRPSTADVASSAKRPKLQEGGGGEDEPVPMAVSSAPALSTDLVQATSKVEEQKPVATSHQRQVQKFRYVEPQNISNSKDLGYRILLATFADIGAAAEDDAEKRKQIENACEAGGGFVGKYYYQYEVRMANSVYAHHRMLLAIIDLPIRVHIRSCAAPFKPQSQSLTSQMT